MKQQAFEDERAAVWSEFERRLDDVEGGYRLRTGSDTASFVETYQQIARDLTLAQARGYSRALLQRLNRMVIGGHNVIYTYRSSFLRRFLRFLAGGFPRRVRAEWRYMLISAALFVGPLVGIIISVATMPEMVYSVLSPSDVAQMEYAYDPAARKIGPERDADTDFMMFGFYIYNNISIGFRSFVGGMTFGLLTIYILIFNGLSIGAVGAHLVSIGFGDTFFSFVSGHSALELTALVLCGGAGLMLGHSLLEPKGLPRRTALKFAAARGIEVVFGAALMLLGAAFIEAFWSSSASLPLMLKYGFGITMWVLVLGYLLFVGGRLRRAA